MGRYSKKAELTGSQSVLDAERDVKKYAKILEIAMNPDEFEVIWSKISPAVKINFILNSQKYVFKEKGRETEENTAETNKKLEELDKKLLVLNKLMNL